jgi:hypothetical protein
MKTQYRMQKSMRLWLLITTPLACHTFPTIVDSEYESAPLAWGIANISKHLSDRQLVSWLWSGGGGVHPLRIHLPSVFDRQVDDGGNVLPAEPMTASGMQDIINEGLKKEVSGAHAVSSKGGSNVISARIGSPIVEQDLSSALSLPSQSAATLDDLRRRVEIAERVQANLVETVEIMSSVYKNLACLIFTSAFLVSLFYVCRLHPQSAPAVQTAVLVEPLAAHMSHRMERRTLN